MKTFRIELDNVFQADQVDAILAAEGIPHIIITNQSLAYNGLFQVTRGWGEVEIPEEYRERAIKLLRDFENSLNTDPDAGLSDDNAYMMASEEQEDSRGEAGPVAAPGIEEVSAMFDQDKINAVMNQTGAERETAIAALKTSDGNVDIAVRIIRSYNMKEDAVPGGETAEGETANAEQAGSEQAGSEQAGSQAEWKRADNRIPRAQEIIDAIKDIWKKGNASRLDIEKGGHVILSISLTVGTLGLVIAPVAALIGLGAALITEYTIKITLDNGTVINVNEFAVTHTRTTDSKEPKDRD